MRIVFVGYIRTTMRFAVVNQIVVTTDFHGDLRLPLAVGTNDPVEYRLELDAESVDQAKERAIDVLSEFLSLMTAEFGITVFGFGVREEIDGAPTHHVGEIVIVDSMPGFLPDASEEQADFLATYGKLVNKNPVDRAKLKSALSFYLGAKRNYDPVYRYWSYYLALMILTDGEAGSERARIDRLILSICPAFPSVHNDQMNTDTTICIAIRDSFSHSGATFSGVPLHIGSELARHLTDFDRVVRDAVTSRL